MFITIDLGHEEAPAFWSQVPSGHSPQARRQLWVELTLVRVLGIRTYCHGREAAPPCRPPSQCSRAGADIMA